MGGYQLKVGGVVVGSWAGSVPNRGNANSVQARLNRAAIASTSGAVASQLMRYPMNARGRIQVNSRLQRNLNIGHQHVASSLSRTISRNTYGNSKVNRQRNRNRNRKTGKYNFKCIVFSFRCVNQCSQRDVPNCLNLGKTKFCTDRASVVIKIIGLLPFLPSRKNRRIHLRALVSTSEFTFGMIKLWEIEL